MASRGKKKTQIRGGQAQAVQTEKEKKDNRWVCVVAVMLLLLTVFVFLDSFTVQANIEYKDEDGNNLLEELDSSQLTFAKSAVTVVFAPVEGYGDAVDFTLKNLPVSKDSEIMQDIAKQLVSSYPQSQLDLLDQAYITIYVTETVYLAATIGFIAFAITVLVRRKKGDDTAALIASAVMTLLSAVRLILALVMCLRSTKEFVITAAGAPWLALVATVVCTVLLAIFVRDRKMKSKVKEAENKK